MFPARRCEVWRTFTVPLLFGRCERGSYYFIQRTRQKSSPPRNRAISNFRLRNMAALPATFEGQLGFYRRIRRA